MYIQKEVCSYACSVERVSFYLVYLLHRRFYKIFYWQIPIANAIRFSIFQIQNVYSKRQEKFFIHLHTYRYFNMKSTFFQINFLANYERLEILLVPSWAHDLCHRVDIVHKYEFTF